MGTRFHFWCLSSEKNQSTQNLIKKHPPHFSQAGIQVDAANLAFEISANNTGSPKKAHITLNKLSQHYAFRLPKTFY